MRNATGGLLLAVLGISSRRAVACRISAVPNPVVHSCQVIDPGRDVARIEVIRDAKRAARWVTAVPGSSTPTTLLRWC